MALREGEEAHHDVFVTLSQVCGAAGWEAPVAQLGG